MTDKEKIQENIDGLVTLRHHLETLLQQYQDHHDREHALMAESVSLTRQALEARLESMNQFRAQILSERGEMLTKDAYEAKHEMLALRIEANEKQLASIAAVGGVVALIFVGVELIMRFVAK